MVEASAKKEYIVPFSYKKIFTPEECSEIARTFKSYDKDNNGVMDAKEFQQTCKDLGHDEIT